MSETIHPLRKDRIEAFQDWRFGVFVHWGLSAGFGDQGNKERAQRLPPERLIHRANRFEEITTRFDPREWIRSFKTAGARYLVMTPKHSADLHFCLFKTKHRNFKSTRDYIAEVADACRAEDFPLILYLSVENEDKIPWIADGCPNPEEHFQQAMRLVAGTMVELVEQYRPAGIWLDGWPGMARGMARHGIDAYKLYDFERITQAAREIDPTLLIGNKEIVGPEIDFLASELMFADHFDQPIFGDTVPTEVCETLPGSFRWFCSSEHQTDGPDAETVERTTARFVKRLVCSAGRAINYLLDTGPLPSGELLNWDVRILHGIGRWLERNGEAIYGTRLGPLGQASWGYNLVKDNRIYLHIVDNRDINEAGTLHSYRPLPESCIKTGLPADGRITASGTPGPVVRAHLLGDETPIPFEQDGHSFALDLSGIAADPIDTIAVLERQESR